jgi:hypothetical protein
MIFTTSIVMRMIQSAFADATLENASRKSSLSSSVISGTRATIPSTSQYSSLQFAAIDNNGLAQFQAKWTTVAHSVHCLSHDGL